MSRAMMCEAQLATLWYTRGSFWWVPDESCKLLKSQCLVTTATTVEGDIIDN